jgi:hypothetical protein
MKRFLPILFLIAAGVLFAVGVVQLLTFRFELGDVYPPYSSLRADPEGTMVLFESLGALPRLRVERDLTAGNQLPAGDDTTYLHLATSLEDWQLVSDKIFGNIEQFVREGGRLMMTLRPEPRRRVEPPTPPGETDPEAEKEKQKNPSLWKRWNLNPEVIDLRPGRDGVYSPVVVVNKTPMELPPSLDWHSGLVFKNLDPTWDVIYARDEFPVVIHKSIGRGSIVIATDSYLVSNEAMLRDRHSDLIAWMLGPNHHLVFDEGHLGVLESPGVATLLRRYRLQWLVTALILLSGLFVWKNAVSLTPRRENVAGENYILGRDTFSGFVNLLRRSIPANKIFGTCYSEWKKTGPGARRYSSVRLNRAQEVFDEEMSRTRDRDAIRAYKTIAQLLHKNT